MPLILSQKKPDYILALWALEESFTELNQLIDLTIDDQILLDHIPNENRKKEFLAVRILLLRTTGKYPDINHDKSRKPRLLNSPYNISISHSRSLVAILLSHNRVGIDTEEITRDVSKIARRFMSEKELAWTSEAANINTSMILCWCIKESVYKMMGYINLDFRSNILIHPARNEIAGTALVNLTYMQNPQEIEVCYFREGNNIVSWCMKSEQG